MSDADRKLGREMAQMHIGALVELGIIPPAVEVRPNVLPVSEIDEIVIRGGDVHIERMSDDGWFMGIEASDGSYWQFWFGAKNRRSHVEFRHVETVMAAENRPLSHPNQTEPK